RAQTDRDLLDVRVRRAVAVVARPVGRPFVAARALAGYLRVAHRHRRRRAGRAGRRRRQSEDDRTCERREQRERRASALQDHLSLQCSLLEGNARQAARHAWPAPAPLLGAILTPDRAEWAWNLRLLRRAARGAVSKACRRVDTTGDTAARPGCGP